MDTENNGFKEVTSVEEIKETLDEIKNAWDEICKTFDVNPEQQINPSAIKSGVKMTLIELNELENLEYVKMSGKKLEKLHETYLNSLIKFAYSTVEGEDSKVWAEEIDRYIKEVVSEDVITDMDVKVENDESKTLDMLIDDVNRIFSISNQLNVIKGMETGKFESDEFAGLVTNFIYLGIGLVQKCNGNAVIMGEVVTFLKVLIKTNDLILKQITDMISKMPR